MQDANLIRPLSEALAHWHEFYALLGTASATLVGLLFVALTVGSSLLTTPRRAARSLCAMIGATAWTMSSSARMTPAPMMRP